MTAKRLPSVAASACTAASANGKVCSVQTMIFLPSSSACESWPLLLPESLVMVATTPVVRWNSNSASCSCASSTLRSLTTSTLSKTLRCWSSCRSARKCAAQAIELVLPEPAECWIR